MKQPRDQFRFIYPETGTVAVSLSVLLGYVLVTRTTGQLSLTLRATYPTLFPEPVQTLSVGLLAFGSVVALFGEGYRQYRANPRVFTSREEVQAFHSHRRFDREQYLKNLGLTAVGALIVLFGWTQFIRSYEGTVRVVARYHVTGTIGAINPMNIVWGLLFLAGFVALAYGLDRLVVALWQELRFMLFKKRTDAQ